MTLDIETQAFRCFARKEVKCEDLVEFFQKLEYERIPSDSTPVYIDNWPDAEKKQIIDARFIVKKDDFRICCVLTNSDNESVWKNIAKRVIKSLNGDCLVLSRNPTRRKWIFSSLSQKYSDKFSETRNAPLEFVSMEQKIPQGFLEFFKKITAEEDDVTTTIARKISDAFDNLAIQIHDELTVNVYEALKILSEGIIGNKSNNLSLRDETLREIRTPIFTLLYRLIFILYAEDRGIFPVDPVDNKIYYEEFSLKWIKKEWLLEPLELAEYEVQKRLNDLFKLIECGSEEFGYTKEKFFMRSYYGRIFDRGVNSKLESWKISNSHLIETLKLLTRTTDRKGNHFFLDYAALDTRHLGAVYEHLLEFHLHVKNKKLAALPDPKERKSSGSYYTPKFVVDYIVEKTVEPLIDTIIEKNPGKKQAQIDKILSLKILDPAMGSGHFLVGVVEYLAKRICKIESNDILEQQYINKKREVVRRCIYGVDYNSLAVDLAKLSLWLETLSSEKPLTFLQAHLKHGNSIIGGSIEEIFDPQQTLTESDVRMKLRKSVQDFIGFELLEDEDASAVKSKVEKYSRMQKKGTFYHQMRGLLDHKISTGFGLKKVEPWRDLRQKIGVESIDYYSSDSGKTVYELREDVQFFHWDLEFPEIFFDGNGKRKENPGFDLVIGNPPYAKEMNNSEIFQPMKQSPFKIYYQGKMDYWYFFVHRAIDLLRNGGHLGYITNIYWVKSSGSSKLRKRVREELILTKCVDFGKIKVFKGVSDKHMIHLYRKGESTPTVVTEYSLLNEENFHNEIIEENIIKKPYHDVIDDDNNFDFSQDIGINFENCDDLGNLYDISQGVVEAPDRISRKAITKNPDPRVKVGDGVFVLSKSELESLNLNKKEKQVIKKYLNSTDVGKYKIEFNQEYLIYSDKDAKLKIKNKQYPNLKKHLDKFKNFITSSNRPYGMHRPRKKKFFENPKIICKSMFSEPQFCYDDKKFHVGFSFSVIIKKNPNYDLKFLLGLLNSQLGNFWFHKKGKKRGADLDIGVGLYRKFPVFPADTLQQKKIIDMVDKLLQLNKSSIKEHSDNDNINQEIVNLNNKLNELVFSLYEITPKQKDYIKQNYN